MPGNEQAVGDENVVATDAPQESEKTGPAITAPGIASAVLGVVCVAALIWGALIWSQHRAADAERAHQTAVLQVAADWTDGLVNMNAGNVEASMAKLRDGTVGELNAGFDAVMGPFRDVVQKVKAGTVGQVDAVAIETLRPDRDEAAADNLPEGLADRVDSVIVVANTTSTNVAREGAGRTWLLRLDVASIDGQLLISRMEPLR